METNSRVRGWIRAYLWTLAIHVFAGLILIPVCANAQQSGNAPVLGKAVQGQNAAGIEGTLETAVNYISNVIGPLTAGGFLIHAMVAWHNGGKPMKSVMTGAGLLGVSQALRLVEWFVLQGQQGAH
jgi:hypothetical protein